MKYNVVLKFTLDVGEIMLANGAETHIIEYTIKSIIKMFSKYHVETIVIATAIFITIEYSQDNIITITRRVDKRTINLNKIYLMQSLITKLKNNEIKIEQAIKDLAYIRNYITYKPLTKIIICSISSSGFALLFDGSFLDSLSSFIAGSILSIFLYISNKTTLADFIINILGGSIIAISVIILFLCNMVDNKDIVIISSIMIFAPGTALTNAIRDLLTGNFVSGFARVIDSTITATAISIGVGIVSKLYCILF